jgi:hypothetical protein
MHGELERQLVPDPLERSRQSALIDIKELGDRALDRGPRRLGHEVHEILDPGRVHRHRGPTRIP